MKRRFFTRTSKNNKNNELQKSNTKKTDTTNKKNKGSKNKTSKNETADSNRELGNDQGLENDQERSSVLPEEGSNNRLNDQEQSSSLSEEASNKLKGK